MEKSELKWGDKIAIMILLRIASYFQDNYKISIAITEIANAMKGDENESE